ncbi:MAG TPA: calcium-binding protein [Thermohalobaculum sp.]|nr:calcium-binding protein [Thermohalobaculum sp.]
MAKPGRSDISSRAALARCLPVVRLAAFSLGAFSLAGCTGPNIKKHEFCEQSIPTQVLGAVVTLGISGIARAMTDCSIYKSPDHKSPPLTGKRNIIRAKGGDDLIEGSEGDDLIWAREASDSIYGGAGDDLIFAQDGDDLVHGGVGKDLLRGEDGDDILAGDEGEDHLLGGLGADRFLAGPDGHVDTIADFEPGVDLIRFGGSAGSISDLRFEQVGHDVLVTGSGMSVRVERIDVADIENAVNFEFLQP